jgi:hypothetical protein
MPTAVSIKITVLQDVIWFSFEIIYQTTLRHVLEDRDMGKSVETIIHAVALWYNCTPCGR